MRKDKRELLQLTEYQKQCLRKECSNVVKFIKFMWNHTTKDDRYTFKREFGFVNWADMNAVARAGYSKDGVNHDDVGFDCLQKLVEQGVMDRVESRGGIKNKIRHRYYLSLKGMAMFQALRARRKEISKL